MSKVIKEGALQFEFDEGWSVLEKWDEHPAYKNVFHRAPSSRAVDIIGMRQGNLYLIEIKDYRGRQRSKKEQHLEEFEQKLAGTVAGLVCAHRSEQYPELCKPLIEALMNPAGRRVFAVYWVEFSENKRLEEVTRQLRGKARSSIMSSQGRAHVKWLRARYREMNKSMQDEHGLIPGLKVTLLPDSEQHQVPR